MIVQGDMTWRVAAIIVAGGIGRRMGGDVPKQYLAVGGIPILARTIAAFQREEVVDEIVLVAPQQDLYMVAEDIVDAHRLEKVRRVVAGGATRQDSTAAGLAAVEGDHTVVLVHDGVRPFIRGEIIRRAATVACDQGAALVAVPVVDTIKRANAATEAVETIPRETLWAAQTPQAFRIGLLRRAIDRARADGVQATDEAMLVERLGIPVPIVSGDAENIKITVPEDLIRAEEIARRWEAPC